MEANNLNINNNFILHNNIINSIIRTSIEELIDFKEEKEEFYTITNSSYFLQSGNISDILGFRSSEMDGKKWTSFLHPDDLPESLRALESPYNNPIIGFVNRYRDKNNNYKWIYWQTISWNGKIGKSLVYDITNIKFLNNFFLLLESSRKGERSIW